MFISYIVIYIFFLIPPYVENNRDRKRGQKKKSFNECSIADSAFSTGQLVVILFRHA